MSDSSLIQLIKRAAVEAVEAAKPCDYRIGTVIDTSPLKIKLSQTIELEEDFLDLTQNVAKENALKKGEKVLMLRKAGGQRYAVIDRVVS